MRGPGRARAGRPLRLEGGDADARGLRRGGAAQRARGHEPAGAGGLAARRTRSLPRGVRVAGGERGRRARPVGVRRVAARVRAARPRSRRARRCSCRRAATPATSRRSAAATRDVPLYSDLLLHDMGRALDDRVVQGSARGAEWRTAPLWGLSSRPRYLHDGRADSIEAAIVAHGGEAARPRAGSRGCRRPSAARCWTSCARR